MWAYYMMHEIRVWRACTLSAQLITDVLWMGQHGFTEKATITHLSHSVTSVCIVLLGWAWKTNDQVISQRSSSTWHCPACKIWTMIELQNYGAFSMRARLMVAQSRSTVYAQSPHQTVILRLLQLSPFFVSRCATLFKLTPPSKLWQEVILLSGFASFCEGVKLISPAGTDLWPLCVVRQEAPSTCSHFLPNSSSFLSHFS